MTENTQEKEMLNKWIEAYAQSNGMTKSEAWVEFRKHFAHIDQVGRNAINNGNGSTLGTLSTITSTDTKDDMSIIADINAKVEMKRLDIHAKQLEIEDRKIAMEERKQELAEKRLEMEEKYKQEQLKLERDRQHEEANFNRQMLFMNMGSRKPDEMMEFLKSQQEATKEIYKNQGQSTKDLYDTLFKAQNEEKNREITWKTEIAKIEADRDKELARYRQENDVATASQTEALIQTLGDKFDRFLDTNKGSSSDDFIKKMEDYNKMQNSMVNMTLGILERQGWDKEKLQPIRDAVTSEEKRQESTLSKLIKLGGKLVKEFEPAIDAFNNAPPPPQPPASSTNTPVSQPVQIVTLDEERKIRDEVAKKSEMLQNENAQLTAQYEEEKRKFTVWQEERKKLMELAQQLGIYYNNDISNEQLFSLIEQEEARRSSLNISKHTPDQQVTDAAHTEPAPIDMQPIQSVPNVEKTATEQTKVSDTIAIQEELSRPREVSPETKQFIESIENIPTQPEPVEVKSSHGLPAEQLKVAPPKGRKSRKGRKQNYKVYSDPDGLLAEVPSSSHRGAAMQVTKQKNITEPLTLLVEDESSEQRKYSCSMENGRPVARSPPED